MNRTGLQILKKTLGAKSVKLGRPKVQNLDLILLQDQSKQKLKLKNV